MKRVALAVVAALSWPTAGRSASVLVYYESGSATPAGITPTRDAFRNAVGGGTVAGANGSFGGARREINWDGVPAALSDPNTLPGDFFNTTSPRGVVFSTPGSGFLVSAGAGGATPALFGFPSDLQAFSPQKLFTAVGSTTTDVRFFVPGTTTAATVSAFGAMFVDVELPRSTRIDYYDASDTLFASQTATFGGNRGMSFSGVTVTDGGIGHVRITAGVSTILGNGVASNPGGELVVMDDFIYAEPLALAAIPEPSSVALVGAGLLAAAAWRTRRHQPGRAWLRFGGVQSR